MATKLKPGDKVFVFDHMRMSLYESIVKEVLLHSWEHDRESVVKVEGEYNTINTSSLDWVFIDKTEANKFLLKFIESEIISKKHEITKLKRKRDNINGV